jgi:hypothetical protein
MIPPKIVLLSLLAFILVSIFSGSIFAQDKFNVDLHLDVLTIPINFGTFIEEGPGYYDISAKGNITQAGYIDFGYWPLKHWGISLGAGVHSFKSAIEFSIPDPTNFTEDTAYYRHDILKAVGSGPSIALQYRNNRFRGKVGLVLLDYSKIESPYRSSLTLITVFDVSDVLAHVQIKEQSSMYGVFVNNKLIQLNFSYEFIKNLFCSIGFETTLSNDKYYPYQTNITGFTFDTSHELQLLNDFKVSTAYSALNIGVQYVLGFGKYGVKAKK